MQSYVAGTDPLDTNSVFTAKIDMVDGSPVVTWEPKLSEGEEARRNYTIYGKTNLADKIWHSLFSQEALKITAKLNGQYHTPDEIRQIMAELTANEIDESFGMFPPFYTDCGKNIKIGKRVFINAGCQFQDQGGIEIGDDVLIGPQTIIATLNHDPVPAQRGGMIPKPVKIGDKVWLGARVTICPGVTIGEGAIVGAGAVVTKDVPPRTVVAGVPARIFRTV